MISPNFFGDSSLVAMLLLSLYWYCRFESSSSLSSTFFEPQLPRQRHPSS